jgi:hypothetical protein
LNVLKHSNYDQLFGTSISVFQDSLDCSEDSGNLLGGVSGIGVNDILSERRYIVEVATILFVPKM